MSSAEEAFRFFPPASPLTMVAAVMIFNIIIISL
jgi:hypothetical protein